MYGICFETIAFLLAVFLLIETLYVFLFIETRGFQEFFSKFEKNSALDIHVLSYYTFYMNDLTNEKHFGAQVEEKSEIRRKFMTGVYLWMFLALVISAVTSVAAASSPALLANTGLFFGLLIAELVLVFVLSLAINRLSAGAAAAIFLVYSVLNGITLAPLLLVYAQATVAKAFFTASGMFLAMSLFGMVTKKDLSTLGRVLFMALIGLIIASVINLFAGSTMMDWLISLAGVAVFAGLTAYDTQKLNQIGARAEENETYKKLAIIGALSLYLDFVNIFIYLLRLFGNRD